MENGYYALLSDVNMHLAVDKSPFRQHIHSSEKTCLNHGIKNNWRFAKLDSAKYLEAAYDLFLQAKSLKGYPMSMNMDDLAGMYHMFPTDYLLFGVMEEEKLIAASTSIRIKHDIIYDFFHGDDIQYRNQSPVVTLMEGVYRYAQLQNIRMVDQGICSHEGIPNTGLCTFKRKLGGKTSEKTIYEKELK